MAGLYTLGEWQVKEGREAEFVAAWEEFARWTVATVEGSAWAKLLRDRDDPRRFVSFGPWRDDEAVAQWRSHPGFEERVAALSDLVESFTPHRMDIAAELGPPTPDP